ncbi:hypothetical protein ACA910_008481 [Epithemia clementina (nom. ined.)]
MVAAVWFFSFVLVGPTLKVSFLFALLSFLGPVRNLVPGVVVALSPGSASRLSFLQTNHHHHYHRHHHGRCSHGWISSFVSRRSNSSPFYDVDTATASTTRETKKGSRGLYMRDVSASNRFRVGDAVRVTSPNVIKAGGVGNLYQRVGVVVETWEKCDVDPTCCCAEQVDLELAVRVQFSVDDNDTWNVASPPSPSSSSSTFFFHYFAEDELVPVTTTDSFSSIQNSFLTE